MNFKRLFSLSLLVLIACSVKAKSDSTKIKKGRVIVVSSSLVAILGGSYLYVENSWWSDKQIPFHFDDGADLTYALNVDKVGQLKDLD